MSRCPVLGFRQPLRTQLVMKGTFAAMHYLPARIDEELLAGSHERIGLQRVEPERIGE